MIASVGVFVALLMMTPYYFKIVSQGRTTNEDIKKGETKFKVH